MTDKEKRLYREFESRFVPGDYVQSRERETLTKIDQKNSTEYFFVIMGLTNPYLKPKDDAEPTIFVLLQSLWGDKWIFHVPLETFLEKDEDDPWQPYRFKRVSPEKILQ